MKKDFLAEVCAAFLLENQEAFKEEYPGIDPAPLTDDMVWERIGKRDPSEAEKQEYKNADTVYLYEAKSEGRSVNTDVFIFGIGVEGLKVTVEGL